MEIKEKLKHLLHHWMEHNDGHAAEYEKWAKQAEAAGLSEVGERIYAASRVVKQANASLQEAIERLMHDRTTIVIAHRLSTIRNADKILVLENGSIVQEGKHDELLKDDHGIYKKLYELQFRDQS